MEELCPLLLDGEQQIRWVVPCVVFFYPDTALLVNASGLIVDELACEDEAVHVRVNRSMFPSRIAPVYRFRSADDFVASRLNRERWAMSRRYMQHGLVTAKVYGLHQKYIPLVFMHLVGEGKAEASSAGIVVQAL